MAMAMNHSFSMDINVRVRTHHEHPSMGGAAHGARTTSPVAGIVLKE